MTPAARATAAAASRLASGEAMIFVRERDSRWSPGFGVSSALLREPAGDRRRRRDRVTGEHGFGVGECRRVGDGRPRADDARRIAGHIRDEEGEGLRRPRRGGEAPALDRREVFPDRVHLADVGARGEERPVDRLLVGERQPFGGKREERRRAAGDEGEHQIVRTGARGEREDARRRPSPRLVGDRVRGFDDLDSAAGDAVAGPRDDEAFERARPVILDRLRHRRRRLAGADDDRPSLRRRRQVSGHHPRRERRSDGGVEHRPQQKACRFRRHAWRAPTRGHDPAEFGEALQPAEIGIARVGVPDRVGRKQMPVVRAHRDDGIGAAFRRPALLFPHDGGDDRDHVAAAGEMLGLVKSPRRFDRHVPQMHEGDARAEGGDHPDEVVVGARAVGADAEGQPVRRAVIGVEERARVVGGRDDPRQPEERDRRVVGMDAEADAHLLGDRHHLVQELAEALAEFERAHPGIELEEVEERRPVIGEVGAGKAGEDDPLQFLLARLAHGPEARLRRRRADRRRSRRRRPARCRTKTS